MPNMASCPASEEDEDDAFRLGVSEPLEDDGLSTLESPNCREKDPGWVELLVLLRDNEALDRVACDSTTANDFWRSRLFQCRQFWSELNQSVA
jgi:hypothetical protein